MILTLHITVALMSLAWTTLSYVKPSRDKLWIAYGFVGLTLLTGFSMVIKAPAHMLEACMMGMFYVGLVSISILLTHRKLARLTRAKTTL